MITNETAMDLERLEFAHGDLELMYEESENRRVWLHGAEAFHRVEVDTTVGVEHIEFRMLDDDGEEAFEQPTDPEQDLKGRHSLDFMRDVIFSRKVYLPDTEGPTWYTSAAPMPGMMNYVADEFFTPLGAHAMRLKLIPGGDGEDQRFSASTIVYAIANGILPVSTTARYFYHDMRKHCIGMLATDAKTMQALQNICQALVVHETEDAFLAEASHIVIADYWDFYTFETYFVSDEIAEGNSKFLSGLIKQLGDLNPPFKKAIFNAARDAGFNVTRDGRLLPDGEVERYHSALRKMLAAHTVR